MRADFVVGVAGWFDLEGGVFDVEMPDEASLDFVEELGDMSVEEAGIIDNNMRGQCLAVGSDGPTVQVVYAVDVRRFVQVGKDFVEVDAGWCCFKKHPAGMLRAAPVEGTRDGRRVRYRPRGAHVRNLLTEALFHADHHVTGQPTHE